MLRGISSILTILFIAKLEGALVHEEVDFGEVEMLPASYQPNERKSDYFIRVDYKNPMFRTRRRGGGVARELLLDMRRRYREVSGAKARTKDSEVTCRVARIHNIASQTLRMEFIHRLQVPRQGLREITLDLLLRYDEIYRKVADCITDDSGALILHPWTEFTMHAMTPTGARVELTGEEVSVWEKVNRLFGRGVKRAPGTSIPYLCDDVNKYLLEKDLKVLDKRTGEYTGLTLSFLNYLLDMARPVYVSWEYEWVWVSKDIFEFMDVRRELHDALNESLQWEPASLARFHEFQEPLELDRDGLFLVTPTMKDLEFVRPVFEITYRHIRGYCFNGVNTFEVECLDVLPQELSYSARGLTGYDRESDFTQVFNPDLSLLPDRLIRSVRTQEFFKHYAEQLHRYAIPLLKRKQTPSINETTDETFLAEEFLFRGKYLQMFLQFRTFLKWLSEWRTLVQELDFDGELSSYPEGEADSSGLYRTSKKDLEQYVQERFKKPILSCRERGLARTSPDNWILQSITICLSRSLEPVDCGRRGTCGDKFLMAKNTIGR